MECLSSENMSKVPISSGMGLVEPQARIRHLASYGNLVEVDPNIPAKRYESLFNQIAKSNNLLDHILGTTAQAWKWSEWQRCICMRKILKTPTFCSLNS